MSLVLRRFHCRKDTKPINRKITSLALLAVDKAVVEELYNKGSSSSLWSKMQYKLEFLSGKCLNEKQTFNNQEFLLHADASYSNSTVV